MAEKRAASRAGSSTAAQCGRAAPAPPTQLFFGSLAPRTEDLRHVGLYAAQHTVEADGPPNSAPGGRAALREAIVAGVTPAAYLSARRFASRT